MIITGLRLTTLLWSTAFLVFLRKYLREARAKSCSVFKNQITFLHSFGCSPCRCTFRSGWHLVRLQVRLNFGQMYPLQMRLWVRLTFGQTLDQLDLWSDVPLTETSCGQVWYYFESVWYLVRFSGQDDIWSDVPPGRDILWPKCDTTLDQVDIWSHFWDRLTFGQIYLPGRDILWSGVILLWVRLTFGQIFGSGWHLVRCTSQQKHLVAPSVLLLWVSLTFGQIFGSGWHLVRCTPRQRHLVAKCVTTLGQFDIWSDLQVRLTFGQMHLPTETSCDPRCATTLGWFDIWSDFEVRLTFGQMYP